MAEGARPIRRRGRVVGYRGAEAGSSSYASDAEKKRAAEYQAFLKEKGWSGLGGAAKRPAEAEVKKQFDAWKKARSKNAGQKKAISESGTKPETKPE